MIKQNELLVAYEKSSKMLQASQEESFVLKKLFKADQIRSVLRTSSTTPQGWKWTNSTVEEALRARLLCGPNGYNYLIHELNYPFPSIRTLSRRLQNLKFQPGILFELFSFLKLKVDLMEDNEKHCGLTLDEMSISEGWEYDTSTNKFFGNVTFPKLTDNSPTDALVFMIGGLSTRWKQIVSYHFTDKTSAGEAYKNHIFELIRHSEESGLLVHSVTSDMGSLNQAMWKACGIKCTRNPKGEFQIQNSIEHPSDSSRRLFFFPDVPHLFKNITFSFGSNETVEFSEEVVKKFNLETKFACFKDVKDLFEFDKDRELKLAPSLQDHHFALNSFQKMRVGNAGALMNVGVYTGLSFLSEGDGEREGNKQMSTTSWYVRLVRKWFDIMSSRSQQLAFSPKFVEKYEETKQFLRDCIEVFQSLKIGKTSTWKPIQKGLILATTSMLEIQEYLINRYEFKYVLASRFSQDCIENLFSSVRAIQKKPSARSFKNILKLITISQFLKNPKNSSYDTDDREYLSNFLDYVTQLGKDLDSRTLNEMPPNIPPCPAEDYNNYESKLDRCDLGVLYHMSGYIFSRIANNNRVCDACIKRYSSKRPTIYKYAKFTLAKQYKSGCLWFCTPPTFKFFAEMELAFRYIKNETQNFHCESTNYRY